MRSWQSSWANTENAPSLIQRGLTRMESLHAQELISVSPTAVLSCCTVRSKRACRNSELLSERVTEMRGIRESSSKRDLSNRPVQQPGIGEILAALIETQYPDVVSHGAAGYGKDSMQVANRNAHRLRDHRRAERLFPKVSFDESQNPRFEFGHDCRLGYISPDASREHLEIVIERSGEFFSCHPGRFVIEILRKPRQDGSRGGCSRDLLGGRNLMHTQPVLHDPARHSKVKTNTIGVATGGPGNGCIDNRAIPRLEQYLFTSLQILTGPGDLRYDQAGTARRTSAVKWPFPEGQSAGRESG